MASSLSYSTFETNQSKNLSISKIQSQNRRKNKTIKKKPSKKKKMKAGGSTDKPTPGYYAIGGMLDKKLGGGMLDAMNIKKRNV